VVKSVLLEQYWEKQIKLVFVALFFMVFRACGLVKCFRFKPVTLS